MSAHCVLLIFDRCFASGVVGTIDMLHACNQLAEHLGYADILFTWQTASPAGEPVVGNSGIALNADIGFADVNQADIVLIPGLGSIQGGDLAQAVDSIGKLLKPTLIRQHQQGGIIASFCTGTFFIAESGLLANQRATTTWWLKDYFHKRYPEINLDVDAITAQAGRIVTAGAAMAYQDLVLFLVKELCDSKIAYLLAKYLILDGNRPSQSAYSTIELKPHEPDTFIEEVDRWIGQQLPGTISLGDLARHFDVSERTLARKVHKVVGKSPQAYIQGIRLERAKKLLITTSLSMDKILGAIGYNDESSFRRIFKRHTSMSPSEFRKRFSP